MTKPLTEEQLGETMPEPGAVATVADQAPEDSAATVVTAVETTAAEAETPVAVAATPDEDPVTADAAPAAEAETAATLDYTSEEVEPAAPESDPDLPSDLTQRVAEEAQADEAATAELTSPEVVAEPLDRLGSPTSHRPQCSSIDCGAVDDNRQCASNDPIIERHGCMVA